MFCAFTSKSASRAALILSFFCLFVFPFSVSAATYTVTNTNDSGAGSLRQAIIDANNTPEDDTITFSIPTNDPNCTASGVCTITLKSGELVVNNYGGGSYKTIITNATGAKKLIISGNNQSRVFYLNLLSTLTLDALTITNGNGVGRNNIIGGGILLDNVATLTLTNSIVTNNSAISGGGIFNNSSTLSVTNSTISNNSADISGGGIVSTGGVVTFTNSTISGNQAANGGGISQVNSNSYLTLTNSTVTNNHSTDVYCSTVYYSSCGGGIYKSDPAALYLYNTIVAGNTAANSTAAPDFYGDATPSSHSIIGNNQGTIGISDGVNGNKVGTPAMPIDARLAPLADNGGQTPTHALLPDSPAVDAGNDALAPSTDQRGFSRFGVSDIGAYELQRTTAASVSVTGRVMNGKRGLIARVYLTNQNGETKSVSTNAFGYYRFDDVSAGGTYVFSIYSKIYRFSPQIVFINGETTDLNFAVEP